MSITKALAAGAAKPKLAGITVAPKAAAPKPAPKPAAAKPAPAKPVAAKPAAAKPASTTKSLVKQPVVATISKVTTDEANVEHEEVEQEVVAPPQETTKDTCTVGLKMGVTMQTAPYNSVRFEVLLHVPAEPDELDEAFDAVKTWVDGKMEAIALDIQNKLAEGADVETEGEAVEADESGEAEAEEEAPAEEEE